ncbi:hypothetical protein [Oryzifoliimicrobium ureilyticus]|uniref:hypothetical protein n=1 Tax=Oryzifoliimicrobium ureilyticus TaxID=3113724 RepID=UPI003076664C
MAVFDYSAGAELYPCKTQRRMTKLFYRRFETAAEALRFAIEEMPAALRKGSVLEVEEARFTEGQMRELYDAAEYPFARL